MCADGWNYEDDLYDIDKDPCPSCGGATVEGMAVSGCNYSPTICDECGDSPCDGSC